MPADGKPPHFPQQPVARQNDDGSLELECFVEAEPLPDIKWFFQDKELKDGGRYTMRVDKKGGEQFSFVLQIRELADSDAGAYKCGLNNAHGKGNANFNLKLTGFSAPTYVEKPKIASIDDGQAMVMEFKAKSASKPTVVWQKGDDFISESDRIQITLKDEGGGVYHCQLTIKDPTKEKDAGQFVCTMKNESGKLTATFTVKFEVPQGAPIFAGKPQILQKTADSGEPAIVMEVRFQAEGQPAITWLNPKGKKMKESSRIKFALNQEANKAFLALFELKNYKSKDSGTYICNIKNEAGEANCELTVNIEGVGDDGPTPDEEA